MTKMNNFTAATQNLGNQIRSAQFKRGMANVNAFDVASALRARGCDLSGGNCDM